MWLVMRGALTPKVRKLHQSYCLQSMTATATVVYEDVIEKDEAQTVAAYDEQARREYDGVTKLEGSYPFTFDLSSRAYRLNKYLHGIIQPELRGRFLYDREGSYERGHLTEEEKEMLRNLDWRALVRYGVIFFILEKLARRGRRAESGHLCRDARRIARGLSEDAQDPGAVLGGWHPWQQAQRKSQEIGV